MMRKIFSYIEKYEMLPHNGNIVAGVSGGPDSVCLLYMLVRLRDRLAGQRQLNLRAVHVNHGLRDEAGRDEAFVETLCEKWGVPLTVRRIDVDRLAQELGTGCEEAGRRARYEAFEECLRRMDEEAAESGCGEAGRRAEARFKARGCIAVAHHRDDRAETFLFHLFRGTGLDGMAGIRPVRTSEGGARVIRPLLDCSRAEIEDFLKKEGIGWCTDATNAQELYARNRIRNRILPYAEREICTGAALHLAQEAELLMRTGDFVRECTGQALERCMTEIENEGEETAENPEKPDGKSARRIVLSVPKLLDEAEFLREQCVRECLLRVGTGRDLTAAHIRAALALSQPSCRSGKRLRLLACRAEAARDFDRLVFTRILPAGSRQGSGEGAQALADGEKPDGQTVFPVPEQDAAFFVPGLGRVCVRFLEIGAQTGEKGAENADFFKNIPQKKYTKWFDYDKIIQSAVFRTRRGGDYLTIDDIFSKKSLKKYMIEQKIPAGERGSLPVLADGEHIMWIPGYRMSTAYRVSERTAVVMEIKIEDTKEENENG